MWAVSEPFYVISGLRPVHVQSTCFFLKDSLFIFVGIGERRLQDVSADDLDQAWAVNARGPLMVAKYFGPLLTKGTGLVGFKDQDGKSKHASVLVPTLVF